jgi:hypothetical protein
MTNSRKSYDLSNRDELMEFDRACFRAKREAPHFHEFSIFDYREIPYIVSAAEIFRQQFECRLLWSLGYHTYLEGKVIETFLRYTLRKNGDVYDTEEQKFLRYSEKVRFARPIYP